MILNAQEMFHMWAYFSMDRGTCTVFLGDALCEAVRVSWHEAWWEVVANSGKGKGTGKGTGEEGKEGPGAGTQEGKGGSGTGKGKGNETWREFDREGMARFPLKVKLARVIDWQTDEDVQACEELGREGRTSTEAMEP